MDVSLNSPIPGTLNSMLDQVRDDVSGEVASYIPELATADPTPLGIALCTVSGRVYGAGDWDVEFTIQSISKPFVYALALEERGEDVVDAIVGVEPSGQAFNDLSLDDETHRPMNPMINAGAIAVNQLINGEDSDVDERCEKVRAFLSRLAGRELSEDIRLTDSELEHADRNLSIAHMLRNYGVIQDHAHDAVLSYTRQCAIKVTCRDLAVMAATLSNGGVQPMTGEQVVSEPVAKLTLSVMNSAGMYDGTGRWMASVGIPAKSGVSGGMIGSLPGQLGIATFSPRLSREGNSVRGGKLFRLLSDEMGLHLMNPVVAGIHAVRHIERHGKDTVLTLQGWVNFSAAETILHEVARQDFSDGGRVILDVTRVVAADEMGRQLLGTALTNMRSDGLDVALYDPEKRLPNLELADGHRPEILNSEERQRIETEGEEEEPGGDQA